MLQPKIFVCVHRSENKSNWLIFKWVFRVGAMIKGQLHRLLLKSSVLEFVAIKKDMQQTKILEAFFFM